MCSWNLWRNTLLIYDFEKFYGLLKILKIFYKLKNFTSLWVLSILGRKLKPDRWVKCRAGFTHWFHRVQSNTVFDAITNMLLGKQ